MKTRLLIIGICLIGFIPISTAFGICVGNPDWLDAPCYGKRGEGTSLEEVRQDWIPYYDYKGSEWIEIKKQEMMKVIQNGTLSEWIKLTENTREHENVHRYYFLLGEVPNTDDEFVDEYWAEESTIPHDPYTDDERLRLASEKKFVSEETMGGGSGMGIFDSYDFELLSVVIIAIIIGVGSGIGLTYYLRKRK